MPVIAGCGSNDTRIAIAADTSRRRRRGADAALHVPPYYNRPNQDGHLRPSRRGRRGGRPADRRSTTCRRARSPTSPSRRWRGWRKLANIVGGQGRDRQSRPGHRPAPRLRRRISSSCRAMTTWRWASTPWAARAASRSPPMSRRGSAPISRMPAFQAIGTRRSTLQDRLYPLHAALFTDASPGPVKYALSRVRPDFPAGLRLPMTPPSRSEPARGRRGAGACRADVTTIVRA